MFGMDVTQDAALVRVDLVSDRIPVTDRAQFGRMLRACRNTRHLSIGELAGQLHVANATIGGRERGERTVSVEDAVLQLEALGYRLTLEVIPR